jgi:hypothetical protein
MRRKKFSAHFALSSYRLKVAVVSSFRGTSRQTLRRHIPGRAHHPGNRVMRTTTGVPAATHTAVSSMRKAYQPGPLSSVAQAAPRYRSGGAQKVRGVA